MEEKMDNNLMEEIIVNGIDVSECRHCYKVANKPHCGIESEYLHDECENFSDCYYKQLKRKEKELQTSENVLALTLAQKDEYQDFYILEQIDKEKLKKECDKLKEKVELLEAQMDYNKSELELRLANEIKRNEFLLEEFSKADKNKDNWREQAEKCEKTLQEIQEVLEPIKCAHPETCWTNRDEGAGDIFGCEPDDVKTITDCPSKVATCILNIIEREK